MISSTLETATSTPPLPRELALLFSGWSLITAALVLLATQNLSVPGLYYDEAIFAGMAKDFVTGITHGQHLPNHQSLTLIGRPFPLFVQTYLGALKSWMLIPSFFVFGSTVTVLRLTTLFWSLLAVLILMLAVRRWLGLPTALISGVILALDPTYFFLSVLDWGAAIPSFVCRSACLYFGVIWYQEHKLRSAFLFGLFAGLGFFNKADFGVIMIGAGVALLCCCWRWLMNALKAYRLASSLAMLGLVVGGAPMLWKIPQILMLSTTKPPSGELRVKLEAMVSMYYGSYFYRLLNVGGAFEKIYDAPSAAQSGLGLALIVAIGAFLILRIRRKHNERTERALPFLILVIVAITLEVMILPYAARIHHMVLVFPFPQLFISAVAGALWKRANIKDSSGRLICVVVPASILLLLASQLWAIQKTEDIIQRTGGRGWWSESFDSFCRENRNRSDLKIVSLDWGFNEQLIFLTDGPELEEPFWSFEQNPPQMQTGPNYVYLVHAPAYSELRYDVAYLKAAQQSGDKVLVEPHLDREKQAVFYTIRFPTR